MISIKEIIKNMTFKKKISKILVCDVSSQTNQKTGKTKNYFLGFWKDEEGKFKKNNISKFFFSTLSKDYEMGKILTDVVVDVNIYNIDGQTIFVYNL